MSSDLITINNLSKVYDNGFEALKNINPVSYTHLRAHET